LYYIVHNNNGPGIVAHSSCWSVEDLERPSTTLETQMFTWERTSGCYGHVYSTEELVNMWKLVGGCERERWRLSVIPQERLCILFHWCSPTYL